MRSFQTKYAHVQIFQSDWLFFIFGVGSGILNIKFRLVWIFENLGSTHSKGLHCVLVACNNGSGSYRKTMSNEGGHNCLNNENKINMEVWILNIEVWKLNIEVWILMSEYWMLTVWLLDTRNKIFRFHSRFMLLNLLGNRSLRTTVKLSSKLLQPLIKLRLVLIINLIISRLRYSFLKETARRHLAT